MKTFVGPIERQKFLDKVRAKLRSWNAIFLVLAFLPIIIYSAFELRIIKTAQPKTETGYEGVAILQSPGKETTGFGTAFLINKNQLITARHCEEYQDVGDEVSLKFYKNDLVYVAKVIYKPILEEDRSDYALLEISDAVFDSSFDLKDFEDEVILNQEIIVAGFPEGLTFASSSGEVTGSFSLNDGKMVHKDDDDFIQLQVDAWTGNSGGPIINRETEKVIGILVAGFDITGDILGGMKIGLDIDNFLADPNVQKIINADK